MSVEHPRNNDGKESVFPLDDNQSEILRNSERLPEYDVYGTALNEL